MQAAKATTQVSEFAQRQLTEGVIDFAAGQVSLWRQCNPSLARWSVNALRLHPASLDEVPFSHLGLTDVQVTVVAAWT